VRVDLVDHLGCLGLTLMECLLRDFACQWHLNKKFSKFDKEQKSFNDLELEMCRTWSKRGHKAEIWAVFNT
jgi:hypothetical protein